MTEDAFAVQATAAGVASLPDMTIGQRTEERGKAQDFLPNFVFNRSKMLTMKPRWIVFSVLCMIAAGLIRTGAAAKKPNFSGTWVLNMHKSRLGMPAVPVGAIWVIEHQGTKFHLERTEIYRSGLHDKRTLDLVTDGKQELVQQDGPYHEVSRMYWSGNVLVLDTKITTSDGTKETAEGRTVIRYSLSPDSKTMTATESNQVPDAKWGSRWVFYRQTSQKSPAAHGQSKKNKKKKIG